MDTVLLNKIKQGLRITHELLDDDIQADVEACLADLKLVGVVYADTENDPLIFNAIKLWCRSLYTDDTVKAAEYLKRYEALKACLMMAEGYGRPTEDAADE
jgi:hypothetical protein